MKKRILLALLALAASAPAAITGLSGFEMGSAGEFASITGSPSVQSAIVRTGTYALRVNNPGTNTYGVLQTRPAGGTLAANSLSVAFYVYVNARGAGSTNTVVWSIGPSGGTPVAYFQLNNGGTASLNINGFTAASTGTVSTGTWTRIVVGIGGGAFSSFLSVGGVTDSGLINSSATAQVEMRIGQGCAASEGTNWDVVIDDVRWYSDSVSADVADFQIGLLIPTAGNNAGSWTDGAGGTGDIHGSVDNIPPVGVAAATAAAKIKNAASGTTLDYVATMQTYTVGGVGSGATVNAVQAIVNDGEEVTTGTKSGGTWIASNPAQSAVTVGTGVGFDYGDDTATVVATYPTGWATHRGVVSVSPSVTLGTAPTLTVRKGSSTTRVVDVDFMGLYVDYTPAASPGSAAPMRTLLGVGI